MPKVKSRYRETSRRRSESTSSGSSSEEFKSKSKRRTRSRERSESSQRRIKHRRSYSRSSSRERHSKTRSSKNSRYRSVSKSRSKSRRNKHNRKRSSKSRSRSLVLDTKLIENKKFLLDDKTKVEKAIEAAKAAGLTMKKIPIYDYKEVPIKEEMPSVLDRNVLNELNSDSFIQKAFISERSKKFSENIIIDLKTDTVKVPDAEIAEDDSLIKLDSLPSEDELREMWFKKLYLYRKKMLKEEC